MGLAAALFYLYAARPSEGSVDSPTASRALARVNRMRGARPALSPVVSVQARAVRGLSLANCEHRAVSLTDDVLRC